MKKTIAILSAAVAGASIAGAEELSISSTFAWESDYIFRGVQFAEEFYAPAIDISYGGYYAGIWAALPVDHQYDNEVDFYAGYGFGLNESVSADVGFTYYTFPDAQDDFFDSDTNTFEIYGGLSFETDFSPAIYAFYDFDLEALTLEASGGHSVAVSEEAAIDMSVYLGYVDTDGGSDYFYYGASAAYVYAFSDSASASFGLNYYGAEEDLMGENFKMDTSNKVTLSLSFTAGF